MSKKTAKRRNLLLAFSRDRKIPYLLLGIGLILFPILDSYTPHVDFVGDAGRWILLALGLNIVVGYAGLLDLGYAAFFAIGSYTFAILASPQFGIHISFWLLLFVAAFVAAFFGIVLGAPTLRLRGDYLRTAPAPVSRLRGRDVREWRSTRRSSGRDCRSQGRRSRPTARSRSGPRYERATIR